MTPSDGPDFDKPPARRGTNGGNPPKAGRPGARHQATGEVNGNLNERREQAFSAPQGRTVM